MYILFLIFALLSGLVIGFHGVINSSGAKAVGLPTMLVFFSFVQAIPALIFLLIKQPVLGFSGSLTEGWIWFIVSGLMGATIVTIMTLSISKIGALTAFVLAVLGQITASAIADHFGFLGMEVKPLNPLKIVSILIIIGGVLLLVKANSANKKEAAPEVEAATIILQSRKTS